MRCTPRYPPRHLILLLTALCVVCSVFVSMAFMPRLGTKQTEKLEMPNGDVVPMFHIGWAACRATPGLALFHDTRCVENDDDLREAIDRALAAADPERQMVVAVVDQGFAFFQGPLALVAIVDVPEDAHLDGAGPSSLAMDSIGTPYDLAAARRATTVHGAAGASGAASGGDGQQR